ncbi:MAG: glutamate 5-kinase [Cyanobacteriota bacterium]|nr:glutamate 5-kinase [Cyanobacteriota bacterium]
MRRVIKIGTSLLRGDRERPTAAVIADLAASINRARRRGEAIALVSSGAVGLGCQMLELSSRPAEVVALQAAAAVGQGRLMALYQDAFAVRGLSVAQVLITRGDLASRRRYQNARRTLEQLLEWGVVPVVNENDTLATHELRFGDNDTLSALVAVAVGADELILLTDVDRLYSGDPRTDREARPISEVRNLRELEDLSSVASGGGRWGTGGMTTKLAAARIATSSGIRVRLADGRDPAVLDGLLGGQSLGTVFQPSTTPLRDRKRWLAHALLPSGTLVVDGGAERALLHQGASLLAVGLIAVRGSFGPREAVLLLNQQGRELGRGISAYGSDVLRELIGREGVEAVHRDELAITAAGSGKPEPLRSIHTGTHDAAQPADQGAE